MSETFPWWWCEECDEEFQENGVDPIQCPSCGSKNIQDDDDER